MPDDPKMRLTEFLSDVRRKLIPGKKDDKTNTVLIPDEIMNERNVKTNYPSKETMLYCHFNDFLADVFQLPVYQTINDNFKEHLMSYKGWKTEVNLRGLTYQLEEDKTIETGRRGEPVED